jgi:hypothetical protein
MVQHPIFVIRWQLRHWINTTDNRHEGRYIIPPALRIFGLGALPKWYMDTGA